MGKNFSTIAILSIILTSCGQNVEAELSRKEVNYQATAVGAQQTENQLPIASLIANDLLGGVFTRAIIIENSPLETSGSASKATLNVPIKTEPFTVDISQAYVGNNGSGKFILSALGHGEERLSNGGVGALRLQSFEKLALRFIFIQYHFVNACLGDVYLHGEIHCDVQGDYLPDQRRFTGIADCTNGPKTSPVAILYITPTQNHEATLNIHAEIDGNPFQSSSYQFSGNFSIDQTITDVDTLLDDLQTCKK